MLRNFFEQLRDAWNLTREGLASRAALGVSVGLVFVGTSFLSNVLIDVFILEAPWSSLRGAAVALVPPVMFMGFMAAIHRKTHSQNGRAVLALLTYFAMGALRGIALFYLNDIFDLPYAPLFPDLVLSVPLAVVFSVVVAAVVVNRRTAHLIQMNALASEQEQLLDLTRTFSSRAEQAQLMVKSEVLSRLKPAIENIQDHLRDLPQGNEAELQTAAENLSRVVADVVRPLSHDLARTPHMVGLSTESEMRPTKKTLGALRVDAPTLLNVPLVVLWEVIFSVALVPLLRIPSAPLVGDVVTTVIAMVILGLVSKLKFDSLQAVSFRTAVLYWATVIMLALIVPRWTLGELFPEYFYNSFFVAHAGHRIVIISALVVLSAIGDRQKYAEREFEEINYQLQRVVARLRRDISTYRKELSWLLHGPVQSALLSTAMEISSTPASKLDVTQLATRLGEVADHVELGYTRHADVQFVFNELQTLWKHSLELSVDISSSALQQCEIEPPVADAVAEFVRECISNAYRHGKATWVKACIECVDGLLTIEVTADGSAIPAEAVDGLGSEVFDELCWRWHRENLPQGGVRVVGEIPYWVTSGDAEADAV